MYSYNDIKDINIILDIYNDFKINSDENGKAVFEYLEKDLKKKFINN